MPTRTFAATNNYRYGFNGKENDDEVKGEGNQQDYGMRIYDLRLGRFLSVDPLFKKYPELTPYQFGSLNPILNIDLDGLEGEGGAEKLAEETGKSFLRVATKNGVEQGAKVIVMKATEKVVESPGFWRTVGVGLGAVVGVALDIVVGVFIPLPTGEGAYRPFTYPTVIPSSVPKPEGDDGDGNKPKKFFVTYTKTKLNPDGTLNTYSGRSSGTYTGIAPTPQEKQAAVDRREATHSILKGEGYQPAVLDESSTSYAAIRGREQQLIDFNGGARSEGGRSRNKIRGVGRNNDLKAVYEAAANKEFLGALPNNNPVDKKTPQ